MEEQKSKEVKMDVVQGNNGSEEAQQEPQKVSYEKLVEIANALLNENKALKEQVNQAARALRSVDRLDYLLRIVEIASKKDGVFGTEFIGNCVAEIENMMTPPAEESQASQSGDTKAN